MIELWPQVLTIDSCRLHVPVLLHRTSEATAECTSDDFKTDRNERVSSVRGDSICWLDGELLSALMVFRYLDCALIF